MSLVKELGQLFFMGLSGNSLLDSEKKFIEENQIGGVIFFSRNVENKSPDQILKFCEELQSLCEHKLFIGIDMEGGQIQRLKAPFTRWPAIKVLGDLDSKEKASQFGFFMGQELSSVGFNLNFAPCLDLLTCSENHLIGDRSLGSEPEKVVRLGSALTQGYLEGGVLPCGKHFPGHGNTLVDSHEDLPKEDISLETLKERELIPFLKTSPLPLIMTAHIQFSKIDKIWPVTLSSYFLRTLLREESFYKGVVISDDLDMKALSSYFSLEEIPVQAFKAGCDLLLYCNNPQNPPLALKALQKALREGVILEKDVQSSLNRIHSLRERLKDLKKGEISSIGCEKHKKFIKNLLIS